MVDQIPPDDLPRSPTGRVPEWVLREAAGEPADLAPVVSLPSGKDARRRRRAARRAEREPRTGARVWYPPLILVAVLGAVYGYLSWNPLQITFPWTTAAGTEAVTALPVIGREEGPRPPGLPPTPPTPPVSSGYAFLLLQDDEVTPVTWSPCRPIHWVVRPDHMPVGGQTLMTEAVDEVSRLTGITFVYDGVTDEAPSSERTAYQPDRYPDRWAPLLIAWLTEDEVTDFGDDILGRGGSTAFRTPSGDRAYVSGEVRLDATKMNEAIVNRRIDLVHAVLLHELGHVMGLDHVTDTQQLMFPKAQLTLTELGRGDIRGFAYAGQGACQPDV